MAPSLLQLISSTLCLLRHDVQAIARSRYLRQTDGTPLKNEAAFSTGGDSEFQETTPHIAMPKAGQRLVPTAQERTRLKQDILRINRVTRESKGNSRSRASCLHCSFSEIGRASC